jgi:hypothetical protein
MNGNTTPLDWVIAALTVMAAFGGAYLGVRLARGARREQQQEEALAQLRFHVADVAYYIHGLAHEEWDTEEIPNRWELADREMIRLRRYWRRNWLATIIDLDVRGAMVRLEKAWDESEPYSELRPKTPFERGKFDPLSKALHVAEGVIEKRLIRPISWRRSVKRFRADPANRERWRTFDLALEESRQSIE